MPPDRANCANAPRNPWAIGPISTPTLQWGAVRRGRPHRCPFCFVLLLTGEKPGFCCGRGGKQLHAVAPLPALPPQYDTFLHHPQISSLSRCLNLVFSFASLETTAEFPNVAGPPGFLAIQGKIYHR
ncbi:hypothetical protein B0H21DRAFT_702501, partial [Amylocystis lapponica]